MKQTYLNPVHNRSCPDPFVLKYLNEYWCYCTGFWHDGRCFGILHSRDLVHWRELPGAMKPLEGNNTCYWAPEVTYDNGRFMMYYSVGNEERMQIRVAEATQPAGPFLDKGIRLTTEEFAIDPHVFTDDDGKRWMFYATDFLTHTHIGTGTVCDEMIDLYTLAGKARPVTRARYDWQVYDPQRKEKGGVRWYTVEGPFVLKHKEHYYQIFSSGNWQQASYGVSYAISDSLSVEDEWEQWADGERILPILRTVPDRVMGPGHNSVIRGPDNQQLFCVYHRWSDDRQQRVMAIDPLDWAAKRMLILGASFTPQPAPATPLFTDYFDNRQEAESRAGWRYKGGEWRVREGRLCQTSNQEETEAICLAQVPYFVAEVSLRVPTSAASDSAAGIKLTGEKDAVLFFSLLPQVNQAVVAARVPGQWVHQNYELPADFDCRAFHLLRVEVNGTRVRLCLDDVRVKWEGQLEEVGNVFSLTTKNVAAEFAGFALTHGWQDDFSHAELTPADLGWHTTANDDRWCIGEQHLWFIGPHEEASILTKGPLPADYELVINAKLMQEPEQAEQGYGFYPALGADRFSPLVTVERSEMGWLLCCYTEKEKRIFLLAAGFDPAITQQFRFRKEQNRLTIYHETDRLGEFEVTSDVTLVGLYGFRVIAAFDLVRVTALNCENAEKFSEQ